MRDTRSAFDGIYYAGMNEPGSRPTRYQTTRLWLSLLVLAAIGAMAAGLLSGSKEEPRAAAAARDGQPAGVGARGRIEPEDGVVLVAAPYSDARPSIVRELRVKEGDAVRAGQIIAVLDNWSTLDKALRQREADLEVARRRLVQLKAGAKPADLEAQRVEVKRWESEYQIAASDQQRHQKLYADKVISHAELDQKRLVTERARRMFDAAQEKLKSLAEVIAAQARVAQAKSELDRMSVLAPADGRVLKVHAQVGEEVGPRGIVELGRTDRMFVIAEVYETDVNRVRVGQTAQVSGELLKTPLAGRVTQIGSQVTRSELLANETSAFADTRVVKVKIRLEQGQAVAGLIYGKVDVVIRP
jgi:HlyD family secretion protein